MKNLKKILLIVGISMIIIMVCALGITYSIKSCDTQSDVVAAEFVRALISKDVDGAYDMLHYDESREEFEAVFTPLSDEWYNRGGTAEYKLKQKKWRMHTELVNGTRETRYACLYYVYSGEKTFTLEFERVESGPRSGIDYWSVGILK